jgi:hypothetical protein
MENQDFDEFIKRQQRNATAVAINWDQQRNDWLARLSELYAKVEALLDSYIASGQIRLEYKKIELNEENIGSYTVREMILKIGRQDIVLRPVGTLLIGFKGRVDVEGPTGRRLIALVDSKAHGTADLVHVSVISQGRSLRIPKKKLKPEEKVAQVEDRIDRQEPEWAWRIVTPPPERRFVEITQQSLFQLILDVANA